MCCSQEKLSRPSSIGAECVHMAVEQEQEHGHGQFTREQLMQLSQLLLAIPNVPTDELFSYSNIIISQFGAQSTHLPIYREAFERELRRLDELFMGLLQRLKNELCLQRQLRPESQRLSELTSFEIQRLEDELHLRGNLTPEKEQCLRILKMIVLRDEQMLGI